ncbi:unnamed protein product [Spodoptera littoralis]|uniref:Uncharacterized protein n=1 Tax=Spodoptera littoralis TaxID=7109 RepID=A0A9P0N0P9_SPOLI|nr:unnamed protein product [Spodoptera littoralis]CAH1635615.1 unnamed protein product [Spodoptera littoralis]
MVSNRRRPWTPMEHQRHHKCVTGILGIRNLRIVGDSGIRDIGEGEDNQASGNLTHTTKHNASGERRFPVRSWYYSGPTGPFVPKHG